jgi:hypothetical protein
VSWITFARCLPFWTGRTLAGKVRQIRQQGFMFSMCRSRQTQPPLAFMPDFTARTIVGACALVLVTLICACSKPPGPGQPGSPDASDAARAAPEAPPETGDVLRAKTTADGIPTRYSARFDEGQLKTIAEKRTSSVGEESGEYRFYGARVTHYQGAALSGGTDVEVEFDMQGGVLSARRVDGSGSAIPPEEVTAIRTRAQLLRSHALTQRSVRAHQTH